MALLRIGEDGACGDVTALDQTRESHARLLALGRGLHEQLGRNRLHRGDACKGGCGIGLLALKPDEMAPQLLRHRTRRACAEERVEHHIAGIARGEQHAGEQAFGLLRGMKLVARLILQAFGSRAQRQIPIRTRLQVLVAGLQRLVMEGVFLRVLVARGPDQRLMRVGEAPAAKIRHRIGLAPDDVVEDPESEILQGRPDPEDVVVAADHEQRAIRFQHAAAFAEPGARETVIGLEALELVPGVIDRIDEALVRPREAPRKLQVIGRIGEDEVDRLVGQACKLSEAIAHEHGIQQGIQAGAISQAPGTRDRNPGPVAVRCRADDTHDNRTGETTDRQDTGPGR